MSRRRFAVFARRTAEIYIDKNISRASAALSYFLMLSIFPVIVCLYEMLGNLFPTSDYFASIFEGVLPVSTLQSLMDYVDYISANHSAMMFAFAVAAMVTTSAAAYRTLDRIMWEIRGQRRFHGFFSVIFSFLFSLLFLAGIYLIVIALISGNWFLSFVSRFIPIVGELAGWNWMRFIIIFAVLFLLAFALYILTAPRKRGVRVFAGAVCAAFMLLAVSFVFSAVISASVKYPLIYGSLASVMITLFWLYTCSNIIILGAVINEAMDEVKAM